MKPLTANSFVMRSFCSVLLHAPNL